MQRYQPPPKKPKRPVSSLQFFSLLNWIDGRPLLDTIEPYRRKLFTTALDTLDENGVPVFNFVLSGRGKKNHKTTDLILSGSYRLLIWKSPAGNDCYILANDEEQAGDDLALAKKLVAANPILAAELEVLQKSIRRRDGRGSLTILPAKDVAGAHGKTAIFIGFDEVHSFKNHDLFEALAPDPTRRDALVWVTSYDTIFNVPGVPLYDFKQLGKSGTDPRMLYSWYSGHECTDPDFAELEPELRANPSIASWPEGRTYLEQQKRRLPSHKFRRLHLNLPGAPEGAYLDQGKIIDAISQGRNQLPFNPAIKYFAFVDMSGGSSDDSTLCICHKVDNRVIVDLVVAQGGRPPFNPRDAVKKFCSILKQYSIFRVYGDNYAGQTFRHDFTSEGIAYLESPLSATELYEHFEPRLNASEVELPDLPKLQEQLTLLVLKGARITHPNGEHDDYANACAGGVWCATNGRAPMKISDSVLAQASMPYRPGGNSYNSTGYTSMTALLMSRGG